MTKLLWQPTNERSNKAAITRFIAALHAKSAIAEPDVESLYGFSIAKPEEFWREVWNFCSIKAATAPKKMLIPGKTLDEARWFDGATLNFAENLLRRRDAEYGIVFWGEEAVRRQLRFSEIYTECAEFAATLRNMGLAVGDRVGAVLANTPEAVIAMLGTAACGGVWSAVSPDFGVDAIIERLEQISPTVMVVTDGYFHKGTWIDFSEKLAQLQAALPSVKLWIVAPYAGEMRRSTGFAGAMPWRVALDRGKGTPHVFAQISAAAPLYILFSSGTTGRPKCVVHSVGGTLVEHLKELILHTDIGPRDVVFYQTTCSWMMWHWLVSSLGAGAALALYDGYPLMRGGNILFDFADDAGVTVFGTNAKFLSMIEKMGVVPSRTHKLTQLKTMLSTGSPLSEESFEYVYRDIKKDLCLSSISGGTDIIGCFALGCPLLPVMSGELQMRSLGAKVEVFDERNKSVVGKKGELVCTAPFPSMPISFWNDPKKEKYREAYYREIPGVWRHGDYALLTERGSMIIYGRSDTTLKPGGVRIGTAEIYRQVEQFPPVLESLAVGQNWKGDVRIVLFVVLKPGTVLDDTLREQIKKAIREHASPHHVPRKIIQIAEIPRTRNGKLVELAVKNVIEGKEVPNLGAIANPEALDLIKNLEELRED